MTQEEWTAIKNCDKSYDGRFYYGLKTTHIVCRPSCHARACNPKNVIIFYSLQDALDMGFRPCRRCCPENEDWTGARGELTKKLIAWVEENYTEKFSLDAVAEAMHMDKNYLIRVFKEGTGMTMLHYHNAVRCRHASELLTHPEYSIGFVGSSLGFKTPSHFSRVYKQTTGKTPAEYRKEHFASFV